MEITITETKKRKINLTDDQSAEIAIAHIKNTFGIHPHMWIKNGKLMEEVEYVTSHSWYSDEEVRKATREDKIILEAVKLIHKRLYNE